jgi:hypothetical protein
MSIHDNVFDLLDEMAEPTGPILSWNARIYIKQYINDPAMSVPEIGKAIADKLRQCDLFKDDPAAIICFERANNEHLLNLFLDALYDKCNERRVLVQ